VPHRDDLEAAQHRARAAEAEAERLRSALAAERAERTVARAEVAGDRIFVGVQGHVVAVSRGGGAELWRSKLGIGNVLVVVEWPDVYAGCHGEVFRLDPATGAVMWTNPLKGLGRAPVTIAPVPRGLMGGDRVFVGLNGYALALDRDTGAEVWRAVLRKGSLLDVVLLGGELFAGCESKGLFCLDAQTGAVRWKSELEGLAGFMALVTVGPASVGQIAVAVAEAERGVAG
jgi:outer membrane protein assembly factor BamB